MKLLIILSVCAFVAAAPNHENEKVVVVDHGVVEMSPQSRNAMINVLIRQLIAYIRNVINNGSSLFGIPVLDPLELDSYHLQIPAGLINLDLMLQNAVVVGIGDFVVHKSDLNIRDLTLAIDISVPRIEISTDIYDLKGDILTAIPIYGNGKAMFVVENFRFRAKLYLGQSKDEKSVIIKKIDGAAFEVPYLKSNIEGAIGGGDIDNIVNAIVEEVLIGYANRFQGAISKLAAHAAMSYGNPILEQLDTWRFIAPLL